MSRKLEALDRRKARVRRALRAAANGRPRLSVFRSSKQIYVQVIDDVAGKTLASASSIDKALKGELKTGADIAAATAVGKLVAERAKAAGVTKVIFDRSGYIYHGRVQAVAAAAPVRSADPLEGTEGSGPDDGAAPPLPPPTPPPPHPPRR
ncbi:50S ribosomal protein L18, partial [Methylobacterium radiotolerans]